MRRLRAPRTGASGVIALTMVLGCSRPAIDPGSASTPAPPPAAGPYLGQTPPTDEPRLFAPGIVSRGMDERDLAITPDGTEIYFGVQIGNFAHAAIVMLRQTDAGWTAPEIAPFSGRYRDLEPCLSASGERLLFVSDRPHRRGEEAPADEDIWWVERTPTGWSEPVNLGPPVNSAGSEFFPSLTRDGTLYFTRADADGEERIFRSRPVDGGYREPVPLGPEVNCGRGRFNAFVAADESYVIVCVVGGPGGLGGVDYFVVFRSADDRWSEPINLGPKINQPTGREWSPYVSPDGRFFFFMSSRAAEEPAAPTTRRSLADLVRLHGEPGNGHSDIWWVDAAVIRRLRPPGWA